MLRVTGRVRARPEGTVNPDMPTGEVEVLGHELELLNRAATPPFQLDDGNVSEEMRLRHRYVDMRRPRDAGAAQAARACRRLPAPPPR